MHSTACKIVYWFLQTRLVLLFWSYSGEPACYLAYLRSLNSSGTFFTYYTSAICDNIVCNIMISEHWRARPGTFWTLFAQVHLVCSWSTYFTLLIKHADFFACFANFSSCFANLFTLCPSFCLNFFFLIFTQCANFFQGFHEQSLFSEFNSENGFFLKKSEEIWRYLKISEEMDIFWDCEFFLLPNGSDWTLTPQTWSLIFFFVGTLARDVYWRNL